MSIKQLCNIKIHCSQKDIFYKELDAECLSMNRLSVAIVYAQTAMNNYHTFVILNNVQFRLTTLGNWRWISMATSPSEYITSISYISYKLSNLQMIYVKLQHYIFQVSSILSDKSCHITVLSCWEGWSHNLWGVLFYPVDNHLHR